MHWRRKWQPTPVFLFGESQGEKSLVSCHLWGHIELDTTEVTYHTHTLDHRQSRDFQKNIYFCFVYYLKAFDCVDHNKLWIVLKEMGIPYLPPEKPAYKLNKQGDNI